MRFLLAFLVLLVLAWRWRSWREARQRELQDRKRTTPETVGMVACRHCGLHVPPQDAVAGSLGSYCSAAHRLSGEP